MTGYPPDAWQRVIMVNLVGVFLSRIPMGRMGRAKELAELVSWLGSGRCSFSTGTAFDLSGGRAVY